MKPLRATSLPAWRLGGLMLGAVSILAASPAAPVADAEEAPAGGAAGSAPISFVRDIRPILSDACFKCHGPDPAERKADLRLDTHDGAFAALAEGGHAIVAGNPKQSVALARILSNDADEKMPPPASGKHITEAQAALLTRWIAQGAEWREHWAFIAPRRPPLPEHRHAAAARNPIDAFVFARLDQEGLAMSPPADKTTLLRRLSLDLTGLPPTIAETDAFLADDQSDSLETQADRLLASPHFGERWGRVWLDAARYADSDGYEKDKPRQVWFYRDWVVDAINRDLPYDQFVIEQIAGDLLPGATQQQQVATGYLRNSMINEEGGVHPEQFRMEAMFDRMDAIGKGVLGITIQCAQCHNHKFDPLTREEYYRLFAFLNNDHEATIAAYTRTELAQRAAILRGIESIETELREHNPDWPARMAAWEAQLPPQPAWTVVKLDYDDNSAGGQKLLTQSDGSLLAQGYAPTKHRVELNGQVALPRITAFRLELLCDKDLPLGGPGRSVRGTCALTEFEVHAAPLDGNEKPSRVAIARGTSDCELPEEPLDPIYADKTKHRRVTGPIAFALDGKDDTAWGIDAGPGRRNVPRKAVFNAAKPIENPAGSRLTFFLSQKHGGWNSDDNQNCNLGRYRFSVTDSPDAAADPLPQPVRDALGVAPDQRSTEQQATIFSHFRTTVPEWQEANDRIEALWRTYPAGSSQLALVARAAPRETHMLERGDFLKPCEVVQPGVPAFLHSLPPDAPPTRLTFARWLVDRRSPTAARTIVNRIWQAYFGAGLVATSEDLGSQSEAPSHPELLDWLAVDLMDHGWSLKRLHRLIVTSATYRQASRVTPELLARDPYNRLLARGARFRVEAETVRDIALASSGLLDPKVGGPSVFPPAPEFLFLPPASYGPKSWPESRGADRYRRALYTFRFRSVPYPSLQAFDAPNGDFACVRRARSNTPLQALVMLNEPLFLDCARGLAQSVLAAGLASDAERLDVAFRRCVARKPTADEARTLLALLAAEIARFSSPESRPWLLAASDPDAPPKLPPGVSPAEAAAWTAVSRVLLNLDETITRE